MAAARSASYPFGLRYFDPRRVPLAKFTAGSPKPTTSLPGCIVGGLLVCATAAAASVTDTVAAATRATRRFTEGSSCRVWPGGDASLFRPEAVLHPVLEGGQEGFRPEQEPPVPEHPRGHSAVDGLDQRRVLPPDLLVELEEVADPGLVQTGGEEVVEVPLGPVRAARDDRADREVRPAREDVDPGVREDEVEL